MRVLISYQKKFKQAGWAVGKCAHCGQLEAAQARDIVRVVAIYFVPIWRQVAGRDHVCDFCQRRLDPAQVTERTVGLGDWQPAEGLPALVARLGMRQKFSQPVPGDLRLHSLLSSVEGASSLTHIDVWSGLPGLVGGGLAGLALGLVVGALAFDLGLRLGAPDRLGLSLGGAMIGALVGVVVGGLLYAWLIRGRAARNRLMATCRRYRLDGRRLYEMSRQYSERVQDAARACRDEFDAGSV